VLQNFAQKWAEKTVSKQGAAKSLQKVRAGSAKPQAVPDGKKPR
jgi:hypothetical protein